MDKTVGEYLIEFAMITQDRERIRAYARLLGFYGTDSLITYVINRANERKLANAN